MKTTDTSPILCSPAGNRRKTALFFAERIRHAVENEINRPPPFPLTISIGLAQYQDNDTLEVLIDRADKALLHAKKTGRNKVVPWIALVPVP
jgi:diguanylate cyclase (GGDEF)-like protein